MALFALILVLVVPIPGSIPRPALPGGTPTSHPLAFRTDAPLAAILSAGAEALETYGAFTIAFGQPGSLLRLEELGYYAMPLSEGSSLQLLSGPTDVSAIASTPVAEWSVDSNGATLGVVHFHAPIKADWRRAMESFGLRVLRYVPQDAFVARGPPSAFERLARVAAVDWSGPYASGWKLPRGGFGVGLADVRIVMFPDRYPETIAAWLGHRGVPRASASASEPGLIGTFGTGDFRWVRARVPATLLGSLAALPEVEFIDPVQEVHTWNAETAWVIQSNGTGNYRYWNLGLDGRGQIVGMADTGLDYDGPSFRQSASSIASGDIYNVTDASRRKVVRYVNMGVLSGQIAWPGGGGLWDPWSIKDSNHLPPAPDCTFGHGTAVASTLAGNATGLGTSPNDGGARGAQLYLQDIGTVGPDPSCNGGRGTADQLSYLPQDYADLFGPPGLVYNDPIAPVRIHSNSWGGTETTYDVTARMVDQFVWSHPDLTILFAAGNCATACGPGTIGAPGTAKDIVTVGGAYNPDTGGGLTQNDLASQSSRGPTTDGRLKPTVVTVFDGDSAMSDGNPLSGQGNPDAHWAGTSYATPVAAAAAAIVRQYFMEGWYPAGRAVPSNAMTPSAALVRAMLIASGTPVTGKGTVSRSASDTWPNNEQGFGRVLLSNVLPVAAAGDRFRTQVIDETAGLLTGDAASYTFHVSTSGPLKFVLAWSDFPGTLGSAKALVNDLDLQVTAPDGTVYRGNHFAPFAQAGSLPGGKFDATNVEEAVIVQGATIGDWTVQVIGGNVPMGPQPFALVGTGSLDAGYGRVQLDRPAYSEADTIRIRVEDASAGPVLVHVASGIEPAGEDVPLTNVASSEIWRGSIRTAFGTAARDGILQVREGDTITATYQDLAPPHTSTSTAKVLASGPTVHDVVARDISAMGATISWSTNEPATTEVRYGTSPSSLSQSANSTDLTTIHAITLTKLVPGTAYLFEVVSRGRLGNATTDTNAGLLYRFQTPALGEVLLVVGGVSFPPEREASYAASLASNGWRVSFWRVADLGLPNLTVLQARHAVLWQVGLEQYPPFNATARDLVKRYLDGGGRLIVSSHDAAWALSDANSSFATPDSAAWVRGVLKAKFVCDPSSIGRVAGFASDPISGTYTAGVGYTAHRSGGADDEIAPIFAGGTASAMWTDGQVNGCGTGNRPIGLRWVSSSPNGTVGTGVWGGNRSRLAYFAFEITGIDTTSTDLRPTSPTRAAILDSALRWLVSGSSSTLDRDHPDVNITSPNGGIVRSASLAIDWTAAAYGPGVGIADFLLEASPDGGQTWTTIGIVAGTSRSYTWNLAGVSNGDRYLIRITARDDGTPSLSASDTTKTAMTLARPSGDLAGPIVWAGSIRVDPLPPGAALRGTLSATADDRSRGGSAIAGAELFLQMPQPLPSATGRGLPMSATDGNFDGAVEDLAWENALPVPPGSVCVWIHAQDASGNWGPYDSKCFVVINAGPDTVPPGPATPNAVLRVNASRDLSIGWRAPYDDSLFGGSIAYRVFRAASPRGPWTADVSGLIPANGSSSYRFVDPGRAADPNDYFYRIESVDAAGNRALSNGIAAKVRVPFEIGLNLLGMPLRLTNASFRDLGAGRPWIDAWTYDACAGPPAWSSALPGDPTTFALPMARGFWVNATSSDAMTALGVVSETNRLRLCAGWNLIGLPGFATGLTVQSLMVATGATHVMGFDVAGPYHVGNLAGTDGLSPGQGYWVFVSGETSWTVPGW